MQPFRVYIMGCGSALPTPKHGASAQVIEIRDKMFLVDCGEGTQIQLRRSHINFMRIQAVFISHLHGDHCFGLIGMISTFGMLGRTAPLHVYAPRELEPMLTSQIEMFCNGLEYEVVFHAIETTQSQIIYEDRSLTVTTIPLNHRISCCGFLFREKQGLPHIRRDMIDFLQIPISQINNIKAGDGWTTEDGTHYPHERLVTPPDRARSYAYCSDTKYMPHLHELLVDVDMLYHESTYCEDNADRARLYYHSTAHQAAMVARDAGVKKLLLGHYSARYNDEEMIVKEAREIFPESYLTKENDVFNV
ncbi:MAG: ribonuclease Z [Prevotella sp.]|nr:ribonuclease Z [Prevotella sp.]MBR1462670.1 ribonuclease Z [Prevotella sp.]